MQGSVGDDFAPLFDRTASRSTCGGGGRVMQGSVGDDFAPLIDHIAIQVDVRRRRARHAG